MDLIAQQQTMKQIRNPFCTLKIKWNGREMVLKKSNEPITLIGRLADHAAKHLYNKVWNQYYDTEKQKLMDAGREKEARKFRVSQHVENKINYLITGELKHTHDESLNEQEAADLSELSKTIKALDSVKIDVADVADVSKVLEQATMEGMDALGDQQSASTSGGANLKEKKQVKDSVTEAIDNAETQGEADDSSEPAFADLEMAE